MPVLCSNNAWGELAVPVTAVATQILLSGGQGDRFPMAVAGTSWFYVTITDAESNIEVCRVTARTADTFTVVRGADSTQSHAFPVGARVELRTCAALLNDKVAQDELEEAVSQVKSAFKEADKNLSDTLNASIKTVKNNIETNYVTNSALDKKFEENGTGNDKAFLSKTDAEKTYVLKAGDTMTGSLTISSENGASFSLTGGDVTVKNRGGFGGNITASGTIRGETLRATSDIRRKENIVPLTAVNNALKYLKPVSFTWKGSGTKDYGFIAQDVRKVLPDIVYGDEEKETLSLNYLALIAFLVAECQSLRRDIEEMKRHG